MRHIFLFIGLLALTLSCEGLATHKTLDAASDLLSERPDSSLAILESIRFDGISCKKNRARYALLKSAAYDKNYIDICSDSLIGIAVDYFSGRPGNDKQAMGAFYYNGIVLKNAGLYEKAIVSFEKAEKIAESIGDDYHLGLINRNKSEIFNARNNIKEAIAYEKKAIHFFDRADAPLYSLYAKLNLAVCYNNDKDYHSALSVLDSIENSSANTYFAYKCRLLRAEGMIAENIDLKNAIKLYLSVPENHYFYTDFGRLAIAYDRLGQRDSSNIMIEKAYHASRNELDSASVDFMKARIAVNREDYKAAHDLVLNASLVQDSLTRVLLTQSVNNAQRDYYREDAMLHELRSEQERKNWMFIVIITLLISSLIIVTLIGRNIKKDEFIKEQMAQLSVNGAALSDTIKQNAVLVSSLFNEKYFHLERLSSKYYSCSSHDEKERMLNEFKQQINTIKDDKLLFSDLENLLNKNCGNVMAKLREQVPSIKGNNIKIISLIFAGIPYDIIQILIGSQSVFALRTAKNRYKKAIISSDAKDKDLFLSLLSTNQALQ